MQCICQQLPPCLAISARVRTYFNRDQSLQQLQEKTQHGARMTLVLYLSPQALPWR